MHEMGHMFGLQHFDLMSTAYGQPQETSMAPVIPEGVRRYFTEADWNAMKSAGWQIASLDPTLPGPAIIPVPEPSTYLMLLAGLGTIAMARRRRV
ncbi:MAG: PEP-CTERM sorting domain-containing protein [Burkholderiaceae bacterium]|nr:PEP-CTERM sorting domain-containing protein [Burkholderiaceae bacterium]